MKIEFKEEKTIVYLHRYHLSLDDLEKLNKEIKNIFIKLIKNYHLKLNGYLKVEVFCNKIYGYILEIEHLYEDDDFTTTDLKLVIYDDCEFYFKTTDYFLIKNSQEIYHDSKYFYTNLKYINNLIEIIEFGEILYNLDVQKYKLI